MKLGKLLAAGKNLVSGNGEISYRSDKKMRLPKFASGKNPFMPPVQAELPEPSVVPVFAKAQKAAAIVAPQKSPATWTAKLNPLTMLRGPQEEAKIFSRPVVQSELSLDSVKVVHNNLTDADVEIVPIKSRSAREVPDLKPAKQAWEILGERLLRATAL